MVAYIKCRMKNLDAEARQEEMPNYILPRLIEWMRSHRHSDKDVIDCIIYLSGWRMMAKENNEEEESGHNKRSFSVERKY